MSKNKRSEFFLYYSLQVLKFIKTSINIVSINPKRLNHRPLENLTVGYANLVLKLIIIGDQDISKTILI